MKLQIAHPGWLLKSEEERRLLQECVKFTLIALMEDERIEEDRVRIMVPQKRAAEASRASALLKGVEVE